MRKVLQVVSCLELGGTESYIMNNYRFLDKVNYQFDFVVFVEKKYKLVDEIISMGGRVFYTCPPSYRNYNKFKSQLKKIIIDNGPYEIIHSHVNIQNSFVMKAAKECGIEKRICHSHSTIGLKSSFFGKLTDLYKLYLIKKYSTHFLACSEKAGKYLYKNDNFTIVNNGIDVNKFINIDPFLTKKLFYEFKIPDNTLIFGNISRFDENKNPFFTINVFNEILKINPASILLMGGVDCGLLEPSIKLVENLKIKDKVLFIGKRTDMPILLPLIDIFIFPSKNEGLGIVLLEAQASKCFCVASSGVPESALIIDDSICFLKLSDSYKKWAEMIMEKYKQWKEPTDEVIIKLFDEKKYSVSSSFHDLMKVYYE